MFSERDKECIRSKNSPVTHYQSHQIGTLGKCAGYTMQFALLPWHQFPKCFTFRSQTYCFCCSQSWRLLPRIYSTYLFICPAL